MWQLRLLGDVLPVFTAFARQRERECDARRDTNPDAKDLYFQALACFNDLDSIHKAVAQSRGEWTPGLDEKIINRLLKALNSRVESRWSLLPISLLGSVEPDEPYSKLRTIRHCIESLDEESGDEEDLEGNLCESYRRCLDQSNVRIRLLHRKENLRERNKFLRSIQHASRHLLNQYYKEYRSDNGVIELSQHPSLGIKALANRAYSLLEKHSRCKCRQPVARREIRLSLTKHLKFQLRKRQQETGNWRPSSAEFEVLIPVCQDHDRWKITNVEVKLLPEERIGSDKELIEKDICPVIRRSRTTCIHLLAAKRQLWVLRPPPPLGMIHHTTMQSLRELLGSGMALSSPDIPRYDDREKLLLSYILASSLLYLYPGDWIPMDWSSDRIFFPRHSGSRRSPIFTLPYLSVNLQQGGAPPKVPPVSQYHKHPAILALGIMLLEIATGVRFDPAHGDGIDELDQADRYNEYGSQALRILDDLERQGERHLSRRILPALSKVVRSCLILNPSPIMAAEQMSEEGPIRHYILSCIATPLAVALSEGYHVSLDELQDALGMGPMPESPLGVTEHSSFQILANTAKSGIANPLAVHSPTKPSATVLTQSAQTTDSLSWITKFQHANKHLESLSEGARSEAIKVAILDTGCDTDDPYFSGAGIDRVDDWEDLWYDCLGKSPEPVDEDKGRHGTALTCLLLQLAPRATVYVVRVAKDSAGLSKAQQDIAKAVLHAVTTWDVDVISMSFGFSDEVKPIKDAIVEAERLKGDKILFFAAANNDGLNEPEMFPAFFESVISARGTKHDGEFIQQYNPKSWGHKSGIQYGTLARDVPYGWPTPRPTKSGCSVATPILAAIAAMLIYFVDSQESWDAERHAIRTRRGMTAVFNLMAQGQDSPNGRLYVAPWQLYEKPRQPQYLVRHALSTIP